MGFASFALYNMERYKATVAALRGYAAPPSGSTVPARDLTTQQAHELVLHYWVNRVISFEDLPVIGKDGKVLDPKPGGKVRLQLADIGGVKFVADNPVARGWTLTKGLQLKNAVLVTRFAQYLKQDWGATVIYWGGLGTGRAEGDRHVEGYAMDFHGADTAFGSFNVTRDWGKVKVPAAFGGDKHGKWPDAATRTRFRLEADPLDLKRFVETMAAREFFSDLYTWLTTQANHKSSDIAPRVGQVSMILHPDTPTPKLRPGHQDHIHFDVL